MSSNSVQRLLLLACVPIVAALGAWFNHSLVLLLAIALIAVLAMITIFSKPVSSELYSLIIFAIALSLLSQREFMSTHLMEADVYGEYYVFRLVESTSHWNPNDLFSVPGLQIYNSMLSVTILPRVFSAVLNLSGEWVFKLLYLFVYSFVPVILYQGYRQRFSDRVAFLSSFYFMILPRFQLEERRVIIGEFFLALLLLLIMKKNVGRRAKSLAMIFGLSAVVSHYASMYLFLFYIAFALLAVWVDERYSSDRNSGRKVISNAFVFLMFVVTFTYYIYVALGLSQSFFEFVNYLVRTFLDDFLRLESRGELITYHLNPSYLGRLNLVPMIGYAVAKIPYLFVAVGGIALVRNRKRSQWGVEYAWIVVANGVVLSMLFVVPHLSPAFIPERFFHLSALFVSPACILGGKVLLDWVLGVFRNVDRWHNASARASLRAVGIFFVALLFFYSGFAYEISGDLYWGSLSLSYTKMRASTDVDVKGSIYEIYVLDQEIAGAKWLAAKVEDSSRIYADHTASTRALMGYGMTVIIWDKMLPNNSMVGAGDYVYLRVANAEGIFTLRELTYKGGYPFATVDLSPLRSANRVYSADGCEIYACLSSSLFVAREVKLF